VDRQLALRRTSSGVWKWDKCRQRVKRETVMNRPNSLNMSSASSSSSSTSLLLWLFICFILRLAARRRAGHWAQRSERSVVTARWRLVDTLDYTQNLSEFSRGHFCQFVRHRGGILQHLCIRKNLVKLSSIEDRGRTDRILRYHPHTRWIVTYDLDLWPRYLNLRRSMAMVPHTNTQV